MLLNFIKSKLTTAAAGIASSVAIVNQEGRDTITKTLN